MVLYELNQEAAEKVVWMIPRTGRRPDGLPTDTQRSPNKGVQAVRAGRPGHDGTRVAVR
jgi:hypothetical protein